MNCFRYKETLVIITDVVLASCQHSSPTGEHVPSSYVRAVLLISCVFFRMSGRRRNPDGSLIRKSNSGEDIYHVQ